MVESSMEPLVSPALDVALPHLRRTDADPRPVVLMTCGISGAGKSTLAKGVLACLSNFVRLSKDALIYEKHGLFGIDYPEDKYSEYQDEVTVYLNDDLVRILQEKRQDIVLDLSFYDREYREEYKELIEANGGRWVLVYLDADKETLRKRIAHRRAQRDALSLDDEGRDGDSAFNVDEQTFEMYCTVFEPPVGEGEIVVKIL